jgi:hypothetical protein
MDGVGCAVLRGSADVAVTGTVRHCDVEVVSPRLAQTWPSSGPPTATASAALGLGKLSAATCCPRHPVTAYVGR